MSLQLTGGELNRRRLAPAPPGVRPTQNRVREAVFSSLAGRIPGCRFLDLFAGTGSVGLEAWSRGAAEVTAVERDGLAAAALEKGREGLGVPAAEFRVLRADALEVVRRNGHEAVDIVYVDPPYEVARTGEGLAPLLEELASSDWVNAGTEVLVETAGQEDWAPPAPWVVRQQRRYGAARVSWLTRKEHDAS